MSEGNFLYESVRTSLLRAHNVTTQWWEAAAAIANGDMSERTQARFVSFLTAILVSLFLYRCLPGVKALVEFLTGSIFVLGVALLLCELLPGIISSA